MVKTNVLTVSQINFYIGQMFKSQGILENVLIMGEISNLVLYNKSGHVYFSLRDETSSIRAVVFSSIAKKLEFLPQNGLKVIVRGRVSVFEAAGAYQIYVNYIEPSGIGSFNLAFQQLKQKLEKKGFFDKNRKKTIPLYPETVGVITSSSGAVLWDIQTTLKKRAPNIELYLFPVMVQGEKASEEIISAIKFFNDVKKVDVIIIARGGGSVEDLWPFNKENLAVTIFDSKIPIISGVGHETDFTICDFASDKRAATPTAAAQIVSNGYFNAKLMLENYFVSASKAINNKFFFYKMKIQNLKCELRNNNPAKILQNKINKLEVLYNKLINTLFKKISHNKTEILELKSKLESFDPKKILKMGYALITDINKKTVNSAENVVIGTKLNIKFLDGNLICKVTNKSK